VKLSDKAMVLVLVPLLFEVIFVLSLTQLMHETELQAQSETRSRLIVSSLNNLLRLVLESSLNLATPKSASVPSQSKMGASSTAQEMQTIKSLVSDRPEERHAVARIESILAEASRSLDSTKQHLEEGNNIALIIEAQRLHPLARRLSTEVDRMVDFEQQRHAMDPAIATTQRRQIQELLLAGVAFNIALALALAIYFNRTTAARLSTLMKNTQKMAAGEALEPPLGGKDEIAELDSVFHSMAGSLRQAEQFKQEFLAMITHDLRTPLTSIEGILSLLADGVYDGNPDKGKKRIETARANVQRLLRLVNELMDLEKLKAGMVQLDLKPTNLMEVVKKSISLVFPEAEKAAILIAAEENMPLVLADSERLTQVLVNFMGNAQKFSPPGDQITIACRRQDGGVEISVSDCGPGVLPEYRQQIFEKFAQASTRLDEAGKPVGTGLGLAIAKSIIQAHGGTIGVRANHPAGSVFWFNLPLRGAAGIKSAARNEADGATSGIESSSEGKAASEPSQPQRMNEAEEARDEADGATSGIKSGSEGKAASEPSQPQRMNEAEAARDEADGAIK